MFYQIVLHWLCQLNRQIQLRQLVDLIVKYQAINNWNVLKIKGSRRAGMI